MTDLYADLGVPRDSDPATIKAAHRDGVKRHHPDKPDGDREAFERVQRAYVVLSDELKRARYDATGDTGDEPDNRMAEAMALAAGHFARVLESVGAQGLTSKDLIALTLTAIANEKGAGRAVLADLGRRLASTEAAAERLSWDGAASALAGFLVSEIDALKQQIAATALRLELFEMAREHLKLHRWRVDPPPAQTSPSWVREYDPATMTTLKIDMGR